MGKQVSILGCGWLGFPLATNLINEGWTVKGSTTSTSKLKKLNAAGIIAYKIELEENQIIGDIQEFLNGSELLIINIPPGLRKDPESDYVAKLEFLIEAIEPTSVLRVIYVSSTGVFKDHESIPTYTEHYKFTSQEQEQSQLIQAEDLISKEKSFTTTIIRFGGLIGKDRHPVKYLAGKTNLKNKDAPVNLIHLNNCILMISEIISQQKFGMVFHGVEDVQLSKEEYYTLRAKEMNLSSPEFDNSELTVGKRIHMGWTEKELALSLKKMV